MFESGDEYPEWMAVIEQRIAKRGALLKEEKAKMEGSSDCSEGDAMDCSGSGCVVFDLNIHADVSDIVYYNSTGGEVQYTVLPDGVLPDTNNNNNKEDL